MFNLPANTEVNRPLPKKAIYAKFGLKPAQRDHFDEDISRLVISHEITSRSVPALATVDISAIYVVTVLLKRRDYDRKNIELLTRLIPQHMVMALVLDDQVQFAVLHERLFFSPWQLSDDAVLSLDGLNLDAAWQSLVTAIGGINIQGENTLTEQILADEQREKLLKQIAALENKMRTTKQPHRKLELHQEIQKLKKFLEIS